MRFLDNVLSDYIARAPDEMARAKYSAERERSGRPRRDGLPLLPPGARAAVRRGDGEELEPQDLQAHPRAGRPGVDDAREGARALPRRRRHGRDGALQLQDGDRADRVDLDHLPAAPRACIEPIPANIYTHKTLSGSFSIKNPYLEKLLATKSKDSDKVWNSILEQGGSVQHLDFLTQEEKDVFKTSFEIDQRWLIELAADRTPFIDQAQSLNLFIPADVDKWDLMMLHFRAWELGIKSLYYLRSKSVQRAGFAGGVEADNTPELKEIQLASTTDYDECLACQ